jgi:hypothetical protein
MKKILLPLLAAAFLFSCNANNTTAVKGAADSTATTKAEPLNLPFNVAKTPDWEMGDPAHVATAMNTLKAFVDNDMTAIRQYLADSVEFYSDNISFKGTKDSLVKFFVTMRGKLDTIDINMQDYESVKSKARGEEWVSMWYVEADQAKNGTRDSSMVMDDIKIVNGKVAIIDSKGRRLAKQ